jgi:molybdate transport repressor ModE-like protein
VKVWLERDSRYAFGLGVCEILLAVDRTGSIKQAASELGKSYRPVWARVKEAEGALGDARH